MREMKIVIIDDDVTRRETIRQYLPDYAEGVVCGYGEKALEAIAVDSEGNVPDMVIMNADDAKGLGLYTFDWMKTKSGNMDIASIPVLLLTQDEFSDKCLDFLEIDDVEFYEGEVDEYRLYSAIMETLKSAEFASEPAEPAFTDDKSYDRLLGMSVKPSGNRKAGENRRSVVLDMDTQLENLEAALERGKKKSQRIKELLGAAIDYKEKSKDERDHKTQSGPHFLNKVRVSKGLEPIEDDPLLAGLDEIPDGIPAKTETAPNTDEGYDEEDIPEEFRLGNRKTTEREYNVSEAIKNAASRLKANPFAGMAAHGMNAGGAANPAMGMNNRQFGHQNVNVNGAVNAWNIANANNAAKKKVVVIDDEERDRRICDLFLSSKYEVVLLDSGMKAIDYFIRNTADLILLDTYMPNLGGVQTLRSIRWQANGKNVPVIYMTDARFPVAAASLQGEGVIGILKKPLSAGNLAMAVDGYFRNSR